MAAITFPPANQNNFMTTVTTTTSVVTVYASPTTVLDQINAALAAGTTARLRPLHSDGDGWVGRNPGDVINVDPTTVVAVS